jgi:hypothetical protein
MTPKEKAKELYKKMLRVEYTLAAKHCALIAVNEAIEFEKRIIKEVQFLSDKAGHAFRCEGLYWELVKKEIEKL